jgi:hypothetical protein
MMERVIGLVVALCLVLSATRAEEEAMSAVDLTEDTFKDKVANTCIHGIVHGDLCREPQSVVLVWGSHLPFLKGIRYLLSIVGLHLFEIVSFFLRPFFYSSLGRFFTFFLGPIQHCFICRPSESTVPTDAGIEPRTVATGALAVRHSNH